MHRPTAAFFCDGDRLDYVYRDGRKERVAEQTELFPTVITSKNFEEYANDLAATEVIFSTWGMPPLSDDRIDQLRSLKAVFYAAGSVKDFAPSYLSRGIQVVSAWAANALPVAQFVLAETILALKGYYRNSDDCLKGLWRTGSTYRGPGVFNEVVGVIGAGMVGRKFIELLRPLALRVLVVDPYLDETEARALEVEPVELGEAFRRAFVVSNHLPNLDSLKGILDRDLFASMREGAVFINTGRGAQVNEQDLVEVFARRTDLTALLDVTNPEPPPEGSPLYELPNVRLTGHIAGAMNNEVARLADCVIEEFNRWLSGQPLRYAVEAKMLSRMA